MHTILELAQCKRIRFHDLRHTFATSVLENGMDVKTLSIIIGHTSAATTLDIYTHITGTMQEEAAASIDRRIGKVTEAGESIKRPQKPTAEFQPVKSNRRKPGAAQDTGRITAKYGSKNKEKSSESIGIRGLLVGVRRLERPASWTRTTRATNCATPRY